MHRESTLTGLPGGVTDLVESVDKFTRWWDHTATHVANANGSLVSAGHGMNAMRISLVFGRWEKVRARYMVYKTSVGALRVPIFV